MIAGLLDLSPPWVTACAWSADEVVGFVHVAYVLRKEQMF